MPWLASNHYGRSLVLEICVLYPFLRRHRDRFERREATKIKVKVAELLALKRALLAPALPPEWDIDRNGLIAKIDPLTAGIH